jgi:hypothetical protein
MSKNDLFLVEFAETNCHCCHYQSPYIRSFENAAIAVVSTMADPLVFSSSSAKKRD